MSSSTISSAQLRWLPRKFVAVLSALSSSFARCRLVPPSNLCWNKLVLIGLACFALSACGEYKQSVAYDNGVYQGKTDQRHWDNDRFKHDQKTWATAVNARAQRQNEYERTGD